MPKTNINVPVGKLKKKNAEAMVKKSMGIGVDPLKTVAVKTGVTPIKSVSVKQSTVRKDTFTSRLIASMDFDEMLEASQIAEMGLRGEKTPVAQSPKVQKYVGTLLHLNERASTKSAAKKMQQDLNVQIIKRNKKTTNAAESKRLYRALMEE